MNETREQTLTEEITSSPDLSIHNYEELAALHAIAKILAQSQELRSQLEGVLKELSARLGMKRGMIALTTVNPARPGSISLMASISRDLKSLINLVKESPVKSLKRDAPWPLPTSARKHTFWIMGARRFLDRSELSFLSVPILYEGRVVGVDQLIGDHEVENLDRELAIMTAVAELIAKSVHFRALEEENRRLREIISRTKSPSIDIVGHSGTMREVFGLIAQVADSNTTVLINGETGTGKELVARAIHMNSPRLGPLIQVNCAAMPDTLIDSELFGHEKGAFTGALHQRRGRFEEAHGGTIFLDEIGELSAAAQAKLLRVIQEKKFQPLGSSRVVNVNVRIIAATKQDSGTGRRIWSLSRRFILSNQCLLFSAPPRDRGSDVILLADHFVDEIL